ncbi:uncharacterized protein LOC101299090 [Anopheles sinensis]|uniref:Uncharacterized protein LOC101299090 n=1 Tax=Anopheles sinensis TaxID=74873 RepID=A0A084WMM4_ANOSI|nr:uncharacterized protein LOC101299090 [Anopheles sinensis]
MPSSTSAFRHEEELFWTHSSAPTPCRGVSATLDGSQHRSSRREHLHSLDSLEGREKLPPSPTASNSTQLQVPPTDDGLPNAHRNGGRLPRKSLDAQEIRPLAHRPEWPGSVTSSLFSTKTKLKHSTQRRGLPRLKWSEEDVGLGEAKRGHFGHFDVSPRGVEPRRFQVSRFHGTCSKTHPAPFVVCFRAFG